MDATDWESEIDELYVQPPPEFVSRRDALVKQARAAKDRELAARIAALRRPSVAAWTVNRLVRQERAAVEQLLELGAQLRTAQEALEGDALRALSRERHRVVAALGRQACAGARSAGGRVTADSEREVEQTLEAALADEGAATLLLAARLSAPLEYAGFGPAPAAAGTGTARGGTGAASGPVTLRPSSSPSSSAHGKRQQEQADAARERAERAERAEREAARRRQEAEQAVQQARVALAAAGERRTEADARARTAREQVAQLHAQLRAAEDESLEAERAAALAEDAEASAARQLEAAEQAYRSCG